MKKINTKTIRDTLGLLKVHSRMHSRMQSKRAKDSEIDIKDMVSEEDMEAEIAAKNSN